MSGYTTRADIYSLGVLALEILNGDQPFIGLDMPQVLLLSIPFNFITPSSKLHNIKNQIKIAFCIDKSVNNEI